MYVDAGAPGSGRDSFVIGTSNGDVRHLGTQYVASVRDGLLQVAVREGSVAVDKGRTPVVARAGESLTIARDGVVSRSPIDVYGDAWSWVESVAPEFAIDGRSLDEFLAWAGRETGRKMGGFGSSDDGTLVSTHLQAGSHPDATIAYRMGQVAGRESAALGCNWAFAPIVDIHRNWRNTVVATRSFGNDPDLVIERAKQFFDGISESRDGLRDQALPRRRCRRAGPARRHELEHARCRGVGRDIRQGLPRDDRPRRAVDHGRAHRRARALAGVSARHPR